MPEEMTTHKRISRMFDHQEADRIPIIDYPWNATIERWQQEGMPSAVSYVDYFGLDKIVDIAVDNSPRYPERVLDDRPDSTTYTSKWGVKMKQWKHTASTPEFLDFTIIDRASWQKAKALITPTPDRIPWEFLQKNYRSYREQGYWITSNLWFGFDVTHAWIIGTERMLLALVEDPEWVMELFNHLLETNLALLDQMWAAGYTFDSVFWYDDMGYKQHTFFSLRTYRNLLKPFHQRAIEWAHAKGIKAHLHSCGDIHTFVPDLVEIGLDALNPLEVKAGMDPLAIKREFGDRLVLHGGVNAVLYDQPEAILAEMERVIPTLKENGGYIFSSDHSVPSAVSLEDFRRIVETARRLGKY